MVESATSARTLRHQPIDHAAQEAQLAQRTFEAIAGAFLEYAPGVGLDRHVGAAGGQARAQAADAVEHGARQTALAGFSEERDVEVAAYRVRVGQQLGRLRVAAIRQKAVQFTIEEFGFNRQETLPLSSDTTKARHP